MALASCGAGAAPAAPAASAPAQSAPAKKIIFTTSSNDLSAFPALIAKDKGFFAQRGVDATIEHMKATESVAALQAGEIQFTASAPAAMRAATQGLALRAIAVIWTDPFWFMTRPDVKTLADVRHGVIGADQAGSDGYVYTTAVLKTVGMTPADVQILPIGTTQDIAKALLAGQIVGGPISPPQTLQLATQGYHTLAQPDVISLPAGGIATSLQLLRKDPDLVQAALGAIVDAVAWTKTHPDEATAYFSKQFDLDAATAKGGYEQMMSVLRFNFTDQDLQGIVDRALAQAGSSKKVALSDVVDMSTFRELINAKGLS